MALTKLVPDYPDCTMPKYELQDIQGIMSTHLGPLFFTVQVFPEPR